MRIRRLYWTVTDRLRHRDCLTKTYSLKATSVVISSAGKEFCARAATTRNLLSDSCKQTKLVTTFKHKLKSGLFYVAYGEQPVQSSQQITCDLLATHTYI